MNSLTRRRVQEGVLVTHEDPYVCSFCNRTRFEVKKIISGPKVYICDRCTLALNSKLGAPDSNSPEAESLAWEQCSFCGKHHNEVRDLLRGPNAAICDECLALCDDILAEEMQEEAKRVPT